MELAASFKFGTQEIQTPSSIPSGGLSYLSTLMSNFLTVFIVVGGILMICYIIWAGILWITSGGDKQKLAAARGRLTFAIVGFIVIMIGVFVINIVGFFFRVNLLKLG